MTLRILHPLQEIVGLIHQTSKSALFQVKSIILDSIKVITTLHLLFTCSSTLCPIVKITSYPLQNRFIGEDIGVTTFITFHIYFILILRLNSDNRLALLVEKYKASTLIV